MEFKELTTKSEAELHKLLGELREKATEIQVKLRLNELKTNHELKVVKKDIARILTHLNNKA
jgi:ribosomal protein L29